MAYVLFGERLDAIAIVGMVACAAAVFVVNRRTVYQTTPFQTAGSATPSTFRQSDCASAALS